MTTVYGAWLAGCANSDVSAVAAAATIARQTTIGRLREKARRTINIPS